MNPKAKKTIALLLTLTLLALTLIVPVAAVGVTKIPTVYVMGFGPSIYERAGDPTSEQYYPFTVPEDLASTLPQELKGPMLKGLVGDWDDFHTYVTEKTLSIMGPIALDNNGEATNGSGTLITSYTVEPNPGQTSFDKDAYDFHYDWRLDPNYIAQILNGYIESVKEATGYSKVNLIARCLGNNVVLSYFWQFGYDSVAKAVFYSAGFDGFEFASALFSGNLSIDADELETYLETGGREVLAESMDEKTLNTILKTVKVLNASLFLNIGSFALNGYFVPEFQQYILPEVLRGSFGSCPGMWSFVGKDSYEDAKTYVFGGYEAEYAGLIEKIDSYHYNVQLHSADLIFGAIEKDIPVYIISKYGMGQLPLTTDEGLNGDCLASVSNSSFGATAAPLGETLDKSYIKKQKQENGGKYLEPDLSVDASTCLLPDHTWFVRGLYHSTNPDSVEYLIETLLNYDGYMTVFDDARYPQFLDYNSETGEITPQVAGENAPARQHGCIMTLLKKLMRKINKLIIRLRNKTLVKSK